MITLYTKTICPRCMATKLQLNGLGLEYQVKNLDDPENEAIVQDFREKGYLATPVLDIDNRIYLDHKEMTAAISELAK